MPRAALVITVTDCRKTHCVKGIRRWFESHELDFAGFLKDGISEEKFLATGDTLARKIVDATLERRPQGG